MSTDSSPKLEQTTFQNVNTAKHPRQTLGEESGCTSNMMSKGCVPEVRENGSKQGERGLMSCMHDAQMRYKESCVGFKKRTEPQATEAKPRCDQQLSDASCCFPASASGLLAKGNGYLS